MTDPNETPETELPPDAATDVLEVDAPQDVPSELNGDAPQDLFEWDLTVSAGSGELEVLTYNVAGLPEGLSSSHPEANHPVIGPLLNAYDLVLVQEDFCYHELLATEITHAYPSVPEYEPGCKVLLGDKNDIGDGLNRFSALPFFSFQRNDWETCNGMDDCASDCLTFKGFTSARHILETGGVVDIYNLHMDAGSCPDDVLARQDQVQQLTAAIQATSDGVAAIVAGDTNLKAERPEDLEHYEALLTQAGLQDACTTLECGDSRIDRILYRSSTQVELAPLQWSLPGEFLDGDGADLSDHVPVLVRFSWETR